MSMIASIIASNVTCNVKMFGKKFAPNKLNIPKIEINKTKGACSNHSGTE